MLTLSEGQPLALLFASLAATAFRAISERSAAVSFFMRARAPFLPSSDSSEWERALALACPPSRPSSTAAGFFFAVVISYLAVG